MQSLANRKEELKLFLDIASGQHSKRILLIEGESGLGKTKLLEQFVEHCPSQIDCIPIDLRSAQLGIPYIFSTVRRRLASQKFTQLTARLKEFLQGEKVEIKDNIMIGQEQQIQVLLNVDPATRQFRLDALREAFFQDLWAIQSPIVLILDTFNEAPPELAVWLGGEFLSNVANTPNLRVVIAGQKVPEKTIEWMGCCEYRRLEAIRDVDAWWTFVQNQGLPFSRDAVEVLTLVFHGQPREIELAFATVTRERRT